jgi:hypothetical protein
MLVADKRSILKPDVTVLFGLLMLTSALSSRAQEQAAIRDTVTKLAHPNGTATHVFLKNSGQTQEVCLGDSRFLAEKWFAPKKGDVLEVPGGKVGGDHHYDSHHDCGHTDHHHGHE